jgi:hypothetical protein
MYKSGNKRPVKQGRPDELFFPNVPKEVTEEDLKKFYAEFGEVESTKIIRKGKGGFAFLRFKTKDSVDSAMADRPHTVKGSHSVTPIRAELGESPFRTVQVTRLFVGNLTTPELRDDSLLRSVFGKYGSIEEVKFKNDDEGNPRQFAVIAFEDADAVDKAILGGKHSINGQEVKIKKFLNDEEGKEARQRARDKRQRKEQSRQEQQHQQMAAMGRFGGPGPFGPMGGWGGAPGYVGLPYGVPPGQGARGYGGGMGDYSMNGSPASSGAGLDPKLRSILVKAKVSEDAIGILARERLLDTELLRAVTVNDLAALGVSFGDQKRIQLLMS